MSFQSFFILTTAQPFALGFVSLAERADMRLAVVGKLAIRPRV